MASNERLVFEKYENGKEEERATLSRSSALEFHYTQRILDAYITPESRVLEIGCATGYYAMQYAGKCKEYVGIDITPVHISIFREKIRKAKLQNVTAQLGDATNLKEIGDQSFDVVLCLGPLYHLPPEERELVFAECRRVCKVGGIAAFAYICQVGVYAGACVHDQYRAFYPSAAANHAVLENSRDDLRPDLFFYTMPEEIEAVAARHGFGKIKNLGTDFFVMMSIVDAMDDARFEQLKPLLDQMSAYESCTGMSNHALLVCSCNR